MLYNNSANKFRGIAQLVEHRSPKPSAEGSIPSAPANKERTFVYQDKVRFLNDVCLRQMMLPTVMMCASHMMCLRAWVANIASLRNEMKQHHFIAKRRNIISRKAAASLIFNIKVILLL